MLFVFFLFSLFETQNALADLQFTNTIGQTTGNDLVQDFACIAFFKALKSSMPQYMYIQALFNVRENKKNLRGKNNLVLHCS